MPIFQTYNNDYQPENVSKEELDAYLALKKEVAEKKDAVVSLDLLTWKDGAAPEIVALLMDFNEQKEFGTITLHNVAELERQLSVSTHNDREINTVLASYFMTLMLLEEAVRELRATKTKQIQKLDLTLEEAIKEVFTRFNMNDPNSIKVLMAFVRSHKKTTRTIFEEQLGNLSLDTNPAFQTEMYALAEAHDGNIAMVNADNFWENVANDVEHVKKPEVTSTAVNTQKVDKASTSYNFYLQALGLSLVACGLTAVIIGTCGLAGVSIIAMSMLFACAATGGGAALAAGGAFLFFSQSKQEIAVKALDVGLHL